MPDTLSLDPIALRARWDAARETRPRARTRDLAEEFGVPEAALVATECGREAVRLKPEWGEILMDAPSLRRVTILTRNHAVVHERHGTFTEVSHDPAHVLVVGPEIDLRIFPKAWGSGFYWQQQTKDGARPSLQFFDQNGDSTFKIFATKDSDHAAFAAIAAKFRAEDQSPAQAITPFERSPEPRPDAAIEVEKLRAAWNALQDTHDFFPLLRRFHVTHGQAVRVAGPELASPVPVAALEQALRRAAERGVPLMVFVGNAGTIQIHHGPVSRIERIGPWLNVLDPDFNLHVFEAKLASAFVVRKPTRDGVVTSLELYDDEDRQLVQMFGERKPGVAERADWRELAEGLVPARHANA
jgi:putative hemin transport protein